MANIAWKDLAISALGGGAFLSLTDQFIAGVLPDTPIETLGLSLKDIATIYLARHFSQKQTGWVKQALEGMAVIGVYKVFYPQFVEPLLSGLFAKGVGNAGQTKATRMSLPQVNYLERL